MCQYSANDGVASDWHITHLGMLVNSGAGLVIAEMCDVERHGRISHNCLGLYSDACEDALTRVVAHCHRIGTGKIGVQLAHAGRKGSAQLPWAGRDAGRTAATDPWETIAPSAIPFGANWAAPRAMAQEDIERVREAFAAAARRAVRCGFDAIELHMAHGYLLHSFVSPVSNRRNDEYGGTLEGRMRFPLEVARAVRAEVPEHTPLGARITGTDWIDGGLTADDAVVFARELKAAGLDYVDVSSGAITAEAQRAPTPGFNVPFAEKVKREVGLPTRTVGLIVTPKQAESIIDEGRTSRHGGAPAPFLDDRTGAGTRPRHWAADVARPKQYLRASPKQWPGAALRD